MSSSVNASVEEAWAQKKLVIIAMIGEGPHAGQNIACIADRATFIEDIERMEDKVASAAFMSSLRSAVKSVIQTGVDDLSPETDENFMNDLILMMLAKVVGGDKIIEGSGLFDIMLAVNPDETRPWDERGLLREEDVTAEMIDQEPKKNG